MDAETDPGPDSDPGPGPSPAAGPDPLPDDPDPVPDPEADPDVEPLPRGRFRCRLCQISAANRPSLVDHLRGKKHRRLRGLRAERRAQEQRSLFVSGFARGTSAEELAGYFGAFGDVAAVVMDKEKGAYAIVELREAAGRELALAAPRHELAGQRLRVRPRQHKGFTCRPPPGRGAHREPLEPGELEQELCRAADVDAQLRRLVELLELSEAERRLRNLLVTLFQEVFSEFFPGCSVLPFGSSVNGFDARGCDLDLLLDLEPAASLPPVSAPGDAASDTTGDSAEPLLSAPELAAAPRPALLELVAAVLRRCAPGVHRVRPVPGARRPVVKFCHRPSGLAGDVSLDNRLGLLNSRFLRLCATADPRVRPLVYALRFWAKQQHLAGNPAGGGPLLSNYALTLLVLFFLQSRCPPVLPPLEQLRQAAGPQDRTVVAGWDCTFPGDPAALEPSANTQTPATLLPEFFAVFGTFDFSGRLLSVREGQALPLPPPATLPGFKQGPLNLQDPFELDHNVAANVTGKTAARFGRCCREAAKYCRSLQYQQKSGKGKPWGVTRLFRPAAAEPGGDGDDGAFSISVPLDGATGSSAERFQEVCGAITFVLGEVLGCGCTGGVLAGASSEELAEASSEEVAVVPVEAADEELAEPTEASGEELVEPTEASGEELVEPTEISGEELVEPTEISGEELAAPIEASGADPAAPMEASGTELAEPTEDSDEDLVALTEASGEDLAPPWPPAAGSKRPHPVVPNGDQKKRRTEVAAPAKDAATWNCLLHHRVWTGRRRLRRQLLRRCGLPKAGGGGWLELEREVTATIAAAAGTVPELVLRFQVGARPAGTHRVLLSLVPQPPQSLFQEFFHFLRSFLPGAVRQRLGAGTGAATDPLDGGDSGDAPTP